MDTFVFEEGEEEGSPISSFTEDIIEEEPTKADKRQYDFIGTSTNIWLIVISLIIAIFMWQKYPRQRFLTIIVLIVTIVLIQMGFSLSLLLWVPLWLLAYF